MKKLTALGAALLLCGAFLIGCGSPCDDLKTACDRCPAITKTVCDMVVTVDDADACDLVLGTYETTCP